MIAPRILAFAGSARRASFNRLLIDVAARFAREAGAEVTLVDLRDFPMPLYDGDLEASSGIPEPALTLKALMREHHGFLIAAPEFNSSITPLLKNTIDWCSRRAGDEPALVCYTGKVAGLLAASPGALGGLRGLVTVRSILSNIGVVVVPQQFALSKANEAFDANGALKDDRQAAQVRDVASAVARLARAMNG
jgi:chromate reductase, NAD(P)H dehydrogenase (quinone)